ncbi:MAG: hypothetical protein INR73_03435 [Williamsia sp.]|nr:hypothetical protein [Williamsia sp.]
MYKLTICFVCCLLSMRAGAQDSSRAKTANKPAVVKKGAKPVHDTCCETIEQFKKDLIKLTAKEFRQKYKNKPARETLQALNLIINRVISRENSYQINLLDAVIKDPPTNNAKEKPAYSVRLMIIDRKSGSSIPLEGTVVFDRALDPSSYLNRIRDSSHIVDAELLANNDGLLIKFNEPGNKPADRVATVPVQPQPETGRAPSKNSTVLLYMIAGLCLLVGIGSYFKSRSLLNQAKATGGLAATPGPDNMLPPGQAKPEQPLSGKQQENTPEQFAPYQPAPKEEAAASPGLHVSMPPMMPSKKHFFAEIMTTAGPRKKYVSEPGADKDLGEDVCGFVADDKDLLIYLLDGTSDLHCLRNPDNGQEYFSSRLLAQSVANQLRLAFKPGSYGAFDAVMTRSIQQVKQDWVGTINKLPAAEQARIRKTIEGKSFPECSTTLLASHLTVNGKLTAYRSGDSKMLLFSRPAENKMVFEETTLARKNEQSNDRLFFRLVLNKEKEFDIQFNNPNYEIIQKENIHTAIAYSDGIGPATEQLLQQRYAANWEEIRKDIIYQIQGTADDKAICFITIRH